LYSGTGFLNEFNDPSYFGGGVLVSFKPKNALFFVRAEPGFIASANTYLFSITTSLGLDFKIGESFFISPGVGFLYRNGNHYGLALNTAFQYSGKHLNYYVKAEGIGEGWKEETAKGTSKASMLSLWITVGISRTIKW
jgi:hypothetical protein